jgi:ABC-type histidine transport system ATPase subunit
VRRLIGVGRRAELLDQFGLEDAADRPISQLSVGMRRRLDLAVDLITRPPLIFLDEPTTGLDPRTRGPDAGHHPHPRLRGPPPARPAARAPARR